MSKKAKATITGIQDLAAKILAKCDVLFKANIDDDAPPEAEIESPPSALGCLTLVNPLKAPWASGQNWRTIYQGAKGYLFQLRPGAIMEDDWYRTLMVPHLSQN